MSKATAVADQLSRWLTDARDDVFSVTTLVTPKMAEALLERNGGNRPVIWTGATRSVSAYAEAMSRGEWVLNGEPIIISSAGDLNDGQHRLHAIIQSGVSVQMMMTFGVERDTRHTVDQGVARTHGHILSMFGEKSANVLATALQFLWVHDQGLTLHARPSTDQLLATLAVHPDIRAVVTDVAHLAGEFRLSRGYIAAAHYLCKRHNAFSADQFLDALTTGTNIRNVNSPVARLRRMFTEHSAKRTRKTNIEQAGNYIKSFNQFLRGRTGPCVWKPNSNESFPVAGA